MPNSKKKRTHKTSPNTAGQQREVTQHLQANDNKTRIRQGELTPWQKTKAKRKHLRILAGKPTQFMRKQAAKSNYKQTGPNVVDNTLRRLAKDAGRQAIV